MDRSHKGEVQCTGIITLACLIFELVPFVVFHTWILSGACPSFTTWGKKGVSCDNLPLLFIIFSVFQKPQSLNQGTTWKSIKVSSQARILKEILTKISLGHKFTFIQRYCDVSLWYNLRNNAGTRMCLQWTYGQVRIVLRKELTGNKEGNWHLYFAKLTHLIGKSNAVSFLKTNHHVMRTV